MVASIGCSLFRVGSLSRKPLSPKPGALSYPLSTPRHSSFRWIGANRDIGNDPFVDKKRVYEHSSYNLTKEIANEAQWGSGEIQNRQQRLAELAIKEWPLR